MKKILEIKECEECIHNFGLPEQCVKMDYRPIPDSLSIPEWCPLPDTNIEETESAG